MGSFPAPYFRRKFTCEQTAGVNMALCGLGYHVAFINGERVGDHVLDPIVSIYDKHARYVVYDISKHLKQGENAIGVVLGNGWYNCQTEEAWNFVKASWRSSPKMILEMRDSNGKLLLRGDPTWKCSEGPIRFDSLRNGETYDANYELGDWTQPSYDDSRWKNACLASSPGGLLEEQTAIPCRVVDTVEMTGPSRTHVYDAGAALTGRARISVEGDKGAKAVIDYAERLDEDGHLSTLRQDEFIKSGKFQSETYILKGSGVETWESEFTYHGFRYARIAISGNAKVLKAEARFIHSDFERIGSFESSCATLNALQQCTVRSYLSNFTGIPTDCPHREKNGWTGDAQLASETGLFNFDASASYAQWLDTGRDVQRPSGELPGIVPSPGWGYNWGNGPAWDAFLFIIPYNVWLHTGNRSVLEKNYDAMKRYLDFAESRSIGHIIQWGLGDWCPPDWKDMVDTNMSSTAYYYRFAEMTAEIASLIGKEEDVAFYSHLAKDIKKAFNKTYYKGKGVYVKGEATAMGTALYFNLCEASEKAAVLETLVETVRRSEHKACFGILGAKYIPRVLAENGHVDDALKLFTQDEYPGWANWLKRGATCLWETWDGASSRNHIMFGDISAWCYRYLGGFRHSAKFPGCNYLEIMPVPPKELDHVRATYRGYGSEWTRGEDGFSLQVTVPEGAKALVILPDGARHECGSGNHSFTRGTGNPA
jgi:alpha-L-rhamnosidase